jgi:N4-gp56 family major capsid protein
MAVNYATTYNKNVVDAFALASITRGVLSDDYKFVADSGKTVQLFTTTAVEMVDYTRSGLNRYGTPTELQNTVQEIACTRERAFAFTIDRLNAIDNPAMSAGKALRKQTDEVITPEIDTYTLGVLAAAAENKVTTAPTADNAYGLFLDMGAMLDEAKAPRINRVCWVSPTMYKHLKLDPSFVKGSDLGQNMLVTGQVGEVDGVKIILAPSSYLPSNCHAVMAHKDAAIQPVRLEQYTTHENPPGIPGTLCEGLVYYDAFVLDAKKGGVAVLQTA